MHHVSDWPFRALCSEFGSAMSYAEFVKAAFVVGGFERMLPRLTYQEAERPVVFQIYGDDPDEILQAALRVQELSPDIIDINLGCPAKTVAALGAGVGLMRTPGKVAHIFSKVSAALHVPLTAKMRLGWADCHNYLLIARIIEENGGAAISVHGRTKEQGYSGQADWDAIAEVKRAVKIPVIGNGDVKSAADIDRMKCHTGCDAVMIGRAAVGNPWIFARLERAQVSPALLLETVRRHLAGSMAFYGQRKGLILFRKHAIQYLKFHAIPRHIRTEICNQQSAQNFLSLLEAYATDWQQDSA